MEAVVSVKPQLLSMSRFGRTLPLTCFRRSSADWVRPDSSIRFANRSRATAMCEAMMLFMPSTGSNSRTNLPSNVSASYFRFRKLS